MSKVNTYNFMADRHCRTRNFRLILMPTCFFLLFVMDCISVFHFHGCVFLSLLFDSCGISTFSVNSIIFTPKMFAIVRNRTKKMFRFFFLFSVSALFVVKVFTQMRRTQQANNFHKYLPYKK